MAVRDCVACGICGTYDWKFSVILIVIHATRDSAQLYWQNRCAFTYFF